MQHLLITTRLNQERLQRSLHLLKEIDPDIQPVLIWGIEKNSLDPAIREIVFCPSTDRKYESYEMVSQEDPNINFNAKKQVAGLSVGEDAVALSHARAIRHVVKTQKPAIILEDDFRLWVEGGVTADMVRGAWNTIPKDTDHEEQIFHKRVSLPTYGNQCYYVSVKFAEFWHNNMLPIRAAADVIWRFPPDDHDFIYRHYYRFENEDGLIWHHQESIKD
jgi:hypothetical protein